MPNKYDWSSADNEQNIAAGRLAGEIRARIGAANFSLPAARDAALAELLAETVSGAVEFDAGSVSAPAIYLNGDTDSGIYWIGTNNLGIAAGGVAVLDISGSGLGVIGPLIASNTMLVTGAVTLSNTLAVTGVATFAGDVVAGVIRRNTSDGADNNGLQLAGGGAIGANRGAWISLAGNEDGDTGRLLLAAGTVSGGHIQMYTGGVEQLRISDAGVVAITTSMSLAGLAVTLGAADSGGSGFRLLRVANA